MDNVVSVRLSDAQERRLAQLSKLTGWTQSQVLRHLLDSAVVRPAKVVETEVHPSSGTNELQMAGVPCRK